MKVTTILIKQSKIIKVRMQAVGADYQGGYIRFKGIFLSFQQH